MSLIGKKASILCHMSLMWLHGSQVVHVTLSQLVHVTLPQMVN